jgi:hypothetical protein
MVIDNKLLDNGDGQQAIGQWWQITSYWTMVTDNKSLVTNKLLDNGDK